ncbi:hypothetical protein GCM10010266_37150 [Streptomyces griseomycini]|nr:hypothetical protein GCM10010266_37150 [Streptomyces griseomycini]GGR56943.1 hypothetical protein GCM10015536_72260 [Streptomyces griseomycini]
MAGPQRASWRAEAWIPVVAVHRSVIRGGLPGAWGGRYGPPVPAAPPPGAHTLARRVPSSKEPPWRPA